MARPHVVLIPYPGSGHINPTLHLAKLLHFHGFYITFVNTEFNHQLLLSTHGPDALRCRDGFRFETIPDGVVPSNRGAPDYDRELSRSIWQSCAAPFRELIMRINGLPGVPPITCVVPSGLMSFALDVAHVMGTATLVLWGGGASSLMGHMRLRELIRRGYIPLKDESYLTNGYLDTMIDWIPGMPPIRLGDISSFVRTTDPNDFKLKFNEVEANNCAKAHGLILNTFDHLEPEVLNALKKEFPCIYTIGPLPALQLQVKHTEGWAGLSLWKEDLCCTEWLDKQKPGSVVYVNFGSVTVVTTEQLLEFAWGLAGSGHPFLWIIRSNLVEGGLKAWPTNFVAETKDRCFLAAWCAQEQVLRHPSVGIHLTHSGWNSTCESIWAGVPMICWPGFADQYTHCKYACEEWCIGLRLDEEVRREQVCEYVKELMGGEKGEQMKKNAADWKKKAEEATGQGGSSYHNLQRMVQDLSSET